MGEKNIYLTILRKFVGFRLKVEEFRSEVHYNAAVTRVHELLANRYGKSKVAIAHLISALGFQLLNEIEQEEGISFVKDILDGREIPPFK